MSIIYDALKKLGQPQPPEATAGARKKQDPNIIPPVCQFKTKKKNKPIHFIYLAVAVAGFIMAKIAFDFFLTPTLHKGLPKEAQLPKGQDRLLSLTPLSEQIQGEEMRLLSPPALALSGIFSDGQKSYAIINEQILKEGDFIKGVRLVRILEKEIELDFRGELFRLKLTH